MPESIRIHPGEILREEFLRPLNLPVNALAMAINVPATRIHEIVKERRGLTADTAIRLGLYFGTSSQFWLNLQNTYDLFIIHDQKAEELKRIVKAKPIYPASGLSGNSGREQDGR
ncbi:MAG: HigA family addiction module antidote protein [Desulfarculales bacterium]|nr:HigA family addiction module antidote protein [Desulfarculales bacterium]